MAERFAVYTYDRRGRGDRGDTPPDIDPQALAPVIAAFLHAPAHANA